MQVKKYELQDKKVIMTYNGDKYNVIRLPAINNPSMNLTYEEANDVYDYYVDTIMESDV